MMRRAAVAALSFAASTARAALPPNFSNPVVDVDAPDPGVQYLDGRWVMATTGGAQGGGAFQIRESDDLVHWRTAGAVFPAGAEPAWSDGVTFWAPEIHLLPVSNPPRYNVYFTARAKATGALSVGVATAATPTGPFDATASPLVTDPVGAIDPTFHSENGTHYVIWKTDGNSAGQPCHIRVQRLTADGLALAPGSSFTTLLQNDLPWEGAVVEAPWLVVRRGIYYLFFSGSGYADSQYCVGVARARSLLGPYVKAAAPVMSQYAWDPTGATRAFAGPGHCSVVALPDANDAWAMVYHAWEAAHVNQAPGRVVLVDPLAFDDGVGGGGGEAWPSVGFCNTPTRVHAQGDAWASVTCAPNASAPVHVVTSQWPAVGWNNNGNIGSPVTARFRVVPGNLPGGTVSLESADMPGHFYRHRNGFLELDRPDGTELFGQDSSFMLRPGLLGGESGSDPLVSLRLINYPHEYIRHRDGRLQISPFDGTAQLAQDGSFHLRPAAPAARDGVTGARDAVDTSGAVISNRAPLVDTDGNIMITGEADVLRVGDTWYFIMNNWGSCRNAHCANLTNDCCPAVKNSACIYATNHTVVGYKTTDFRSWTNLGVLVPVSVRAEGTLFRPHVVQNPRSGKFVMWFENFNLTGDPAACGAATGGCHYSVAVADRPEGPWKVILDGPSNGAKFKCSTAEGDFDLFVDNDGTGYVVLTHYTELCIERLNDDFTGGTGDTYTIPGQSLTGVAGEAPAMFVRRGLYYVTWGSGCCACSVGASVFVHVSRSPLGPYTYLGDVGTAPGHKACNSCDGDFVTRAQQASVFDVGGSPPRDGVLVWLGNHWQSSLDGQLNHDLLYFTPLEFEPNGSIKHLAWHDNVSIPVGGQ